jgi:alpha-tubulin suppressor-like RCC1 family protein
MEVDLMRRLISLRIPQVIALVMLSPLIAGQPGGVATSTSVCTVNTFSAGSLYSGAVKSSGALLTWGRNYEGQLGIGTIGGQTGSPTPVITTTGLTTVAGFWAGAFTTFAVDPSGQLWSWGDGSFNQRGNNAGYVSPAPVVGPTHVVSVGAGAEHTIAATADGTVWGWGVVRAFGVQLPGNFLFSNPVVVPGLPQITKVAAGEIYSLALSSGGTVYGAGYNDSGQLGLGSGVFQATTFQPIPGLSGVVDIAASDAAGGSFSVAVDGNGHVFAVGSDFYGQMGNGSFSPTPQFAATQVSGLDSVVSVSAGNGHVLALKSDLTVWAWGENESGQLGNGSTTNSSRPVQVTFPSGVKLVSVSAGLVHSMALDTNGNLWAWGHDGNGEIGNGFAPGIPVTQPIKVNLGTIAMPCGPPPAPSYLPSVNGYQFLNDGGITAPSYDRMAAFYPASRHEMYYSAFGFTVPSVIGFDFYTALFKPFYVGYPLVGGAGLCFGMVVSNQVLFSHFPDQSAYQTYDSLHSDFHGSFAGSLEPSDQRIEDFIDRYHSRQLAESGALAAIATYTNTESTGGNRAAFDAIAAGVAGGKTMWLGLGPSLAVLKELIVGPGRYVKLFLASHAVLAYGVDKPNQRIKIYDPNSPFDDGAYIQIVDSSMNPGGGIMLIHHGDPHNVTYGGGTSSGEDLGSPGEWTLMPLPEGAFAGDNQHWILDLAGTLAWTSGAVLPLYNGTPVFRILDARVPDQASIELLPAGTGLQTTITPAASGAQTSQITGSHVAQVTETDAAAVGTTHQVSLNPDASQITLSGASSVQQYSAMLGADFLPSSYGRRMTVGGATLIPGGTLVINTDSTYSSLNLSGSSMPGQQASLLLEQLGQGAGSTNVRVTIPGGGSRGAVFVGDWTALGQSLVFEVITGANGHVTGLVLQDNPGQRQLLTNSLLQSIQAGIAQVADAGVRNSLQAKLDNASKQIAKGDPGTAANVLEALNNEVAAQSGVTIPSGLAASLQASLQELIGLLRAPLAR